MRANKKREFINGLVFDNDHFKNEIKRMEEKKEYLGWWLGSRYTKFRFQKMIEENETMLKKIGEDKNYKPWKDE